MSTTRRPLCLLALDGGGVRGLSELHILNEMMLRVQKHRNLPAPPKPCELFDLICGTSTGGLIALMLGRLKMSVGEVLTEYCSVAREVFGKSKGGVREGRFKATVLENCIRNTVQNYGTPQGENDKADPDLKLLNEQSVDGCQVFVCSRNARAMNVVRLLRSYPSFSADQYPDMKVWEAARATSAAPTFFKRLSIGPKNAQEDFLDGGMGSNNPTKILIEEAVRLYGSEDPVACIVSIGTGKPRITEFKSPGLFQQALPLDLINALKDMTTDCEAVAEELERKFSSRPGIYFRFNVDRGLEDVGLEEWKELGNIKSKTISYLAEDRVHRAIDAVANALDIRDTRIKISELNLTLHVQQLPDATKSHSVPKCFVPFERKVSNFVGRTQVLDSIRAVFNKESGDPPESSTVVLRAMGGQGKTQVALEYCRSAQNQDYDYILWVNAETQLSLKQDFTSFLGALPQAKTPEEAMVFEAMTENMSTFDIARERLMSKRYLMVIDNLDVPSEHRDIKKYMTMGGSTHIIITSRHIDAERLGVLIDLPPFSVKEGSQLLTRQSGREQSDNSSDDQEQIVLALGGLPLALDQAALLIREKNLTYSQFLQEFQTARAILQDKDLPEFWEYEKLAFGSAKELEIRRKIGIQTTWTMSFEYLKSQPQGKSKCHLLTLSAYLSNTTISQSIFSPFLERILLVSKKLDTALSQACPEDRLEVGVSNRLELQTLISAMDWVRPLLDETGNITISGTFSNFIRDAYKIGLINSTQYHETRGVVYSLHPLISRWLTDQDNDDCIFEAFFLVHFLLLAMKTDDLTSISLLPEIDRHVHACIGLSKRLPTASRLGEGDLQTVGFLFCSHALNSLLPTVGGIIDILKAAFKHSKQLPKELNMIHYTQIPYALGDAYKNAEELTKAKEFLQLALARQSPNLNEDIVKTLSSLAEVYVRLKDDTAPITIYQCLLGPSQLVPGSEDSSSVSRMRVLPGNLPADFWLRTFEIVSYSFKPRYDLAEAALVHFLHEARQIYRDTDVADLRWLIVAAQFSLGIVYFISKDWRKAQDQFESLLHGIQADETTNIILVIEIGGLFLTAAAKQLEDEKTHFMTDFVLDKVIKRNSSQDQMEKIKIISGSTIKELFLMNPSAGCETFVRMLWRLFLPKSTILHPINALKEHVTSAIINGEHNKELLHRAEIYLQYCIDMVGNTNDTQAAYFFALAVAYNLCEWKICERLSREQLQRDEVSGKQPDELTIYSLGCAYIHLEDHEKYQRHKEQYPLIDWSRVE